MKVVNVFAAVDYAFIYSIYKAFTDYKSFTVYFGYAVVNSYTCEIIAACFAICEQNSQDYLKYVYD